jgi:CheY-like chemotaxis protein
MHLLATAASPAPPVHDTAMPPVSYASASDRDLVDLLAVIVGVCETLETRLGGGSQHRELAQVGLLAANRAAELVSRQRPPAPAPPANDHGVDAERLSVLVVEDDPALLDLMTGAFQRAGYRAHGARNGREGVRLLVDLQPELMVTDIVMPEMEGIGAILEARRCSPSTRVIAISGGGAYGRSCDFLGWASELGADEVLAKPFRVSSLITAARLVLERASRA